MENTELLLRSIIESANDAIVTSDSGGNITSWNQAAVDIFGYSHDEIIGKPVITIMPQRFHEAHRKGMKRVTTTGESHIIGSTVEILGLRKDGSEIPIELSLAKWTTKDGQFFTAIIRDITKRKRAEEELKRSKEFSEKVLNNITDAVSVINVGDFTIAGVNTAFLQAYNYKEEEVIGKTCYEITHHRSVPCTAPDDVCPLDDVITSEQPAAVEHVHHSKDGKKSNVEVSAFPIIDEGGRTTQIIHVVKDITERKQTEEALREREEKFSRAFHSNPHPMSIVTMAEGRYLDVNDSYVQTFGFSREELLGRTTVEMGILKNDRARRKILQSLKERQVIKNLELEFYTRSGRKVDALLSGDKVEIGSQTCLLSIITDITERKQAEEKRTQLIQELQETLKEVRTLSGLLPICAWCKKLRDDEGYWKSVEQYIGERTKAEFTHGICPECNEKFLQKKTVN